MAKQREADEVNTCPACKRHNISYAGLIKSGKIQAYYPAVCDDCGCCFNEWYALDFTVSIQC